MANAQPHTHSPVAASPVDLGGGRRQLHDGTTIALRTIEMQPHAAVSGDERAAVLAQVADRVVGYVSYERVYGPRAELVIDIEEDFWHRGLAEVMICALGARACRLGITTFLVRAHAGDLRLLAMLREHFGALGSRSGGFVELEFATRPWPTR